MRGDLETVYLNLLLLKRTKLWLVTLEQHAMNLHFLVLSTSFIIRCSNVDVLQLVHYVENLRRYAREY